MVYGYLDKKKYIVGREKMRLAVRSNTASLGERGTTAEGIKIVVGTERAGMA